MNNFVVFDNGGVTADRYTIVNRESGNVFAISADAGHTWFCGNCADHRVTLFGAGWRQMPLSKRIIHTETDNYIRNAQLDPSWLGKELDSRKLSDELRLYIERLEDWVPLGTPGTVTRLTA